MSLLRLLAKGVMALILEQFADLRIICDSMLLIENSKMAPEATPPATNLCAESCCAICQFAIAVPRSAFDGATETEVSLPCGHVFGNLCIERWLERDSVRKDCPICRRKMVYRDCGCPIRPCEVVGAPSTIRREEDMPRRCVGCGGSAGVQELEDIILKVRRRGEKEERVLEGLKRIPRGLGFGLISFGWDKTEYEKRLEDSKAFVRRDVMEIVRRFEEEEGRKWW